MSNFDIVKDIFFKDLVLKHFVFENGIFHNNESNLIDDYLYQDKSSHDLILKESTVFFSFNDGILLLYRDSVLMCDSEADLRYMGDTPLAALSEVNKSPEYWGVFEINDFSGFTNDFKNRFGDMNSIRCSKKALKFYRENDLS